MSARQRVPSYDGVTVPAGDETDPARLLAEGELAVLGRVLPASNLTLLAEAQLDGQSVRCVYKPISGERPLWDFPDGSLAGREVAAYQVSEALGWGLVPRTILREGPVGPGMVQLWVEHDDTQAPVDVVPLGEVPDGFLGVLDARDAEGSAVTLVHEDNPLLRRMAVFDALVNNADRKGGHVLATVGGGRYGVDHGVCFHVEPKLRTVLWGWATLPLTDEERTGVGEVLDRLDSAQDPLRTALDRLLSPGETAAVRQRAEDLLVHGRMPLPGGEWPAIPWPAF